MVQRIKLERVPEKSSGGLRLPISVVQTT